MKLSLLFIILALGILVAGCTDSGPVGAQTDACRQACVNQLPTNYSNWTWKVWFNETDTGPVQTSCTCEVN